MSLLNDALRKKKSEHQAKGKSLADGFMNLGSKSKSRRLWTAVLCGLALAAAGSAAWWFGSAFDSGTSLAVVDSQVGPPNAPLDSSNDAQATAGGIPTPIARASEPNGPSAETVIKPVESDTADKVLQSQVKTNSAPGTVRAPQPSSVASKSRAIASHKAPSIYHVSRHKAHRAKPVSASSGSSANPGQGVDRQRIERLFQKALQYHRRDRLNLAIALYQEVLKIDHGYEKASFNLVAAYLQIKAYAKAYPVAMDLYHRQPNNQQVILNLAIAQIGCERFQEAISLLNKAESLPNAALYEIAFHKAVAYGRLNQLQDALTWYKRAEAMHPDDPELLFNLALAYDQQRQYDTAIEYYLQYMEHDAQKDPLQIKKIRGRVSLLRAYSARKKSEE